MSLISDIISDALYYIGAYGAQEPVSSDDLAFGQRIVGRLLDSWSARKLSPLGILRAPYTLSGAASYTYGPTTTWAATTRPMKIKAASVLAANGVEKECHVCTAEEWAAVPDKTRTGIYAEALYWDAGFPTGIIYVSPMPGAGSCVLYTYEAIGQTTGLSDTVSLPPGYERPLVLAFALELCIPFQRPIPDGLPQLAQEAEMTIASLSAEILGTPVPQPPQQQPQGAKQ